MAPHVRRQHRQLLEDFLDRQANAERKEAAVAGAQTQQQRLAAALEQAKPATIRITPVFQLDESDYLGKQGPAATKYLRDVVVPAATRVIQKYVKVRIPRTSPVKANLPMGAECGATTIRKQLSAPAGGAGYANTDLVIYVSAKSEGCPDLAVGYATACDWDPVTKRPIVAAFNVCPPTASTNVIVEENIGAVVHEFLHALGFYNELFPQFYDYRTGKPHAKPLMYVNGRPFMSTPKVKAVAREHFACPSLPGGPLEEAGGSASAASHWESLQLNHEVITPIQPEDSQRYRFSNFTLALLEDSGFYVPNYAAAQPLDWMYGAGCDAVLKTTSFQGCINYAVQHPQQQELCRPSQALLSGRQQWSCSYNSRASVVCQEGLTSLYGNGCETGFTYSAEPYSCTDTRAEWLPEELQKHKDMGLSIGSRDSRCFALSDGTACARTAAGRLVCSESTFLCARATCNAKREPVMLVKLRDGTTAQVLCNQATVNLAAALPGHFTNGTMFCPPANMCLSLPTCGTCKKGDCWKGKCYCYLEATGPTCDKSLIPPLPSSKYKMYRE